MLTIRKNAMKLSSDYIESYSETILADQNHICLKKGPDGNQVVFCVTNKSSSGDAYDIDITNAFKADDKIIDVVSCKTQTADATGGIKGHMGQGEPKVFVLESSLEGTNLCPTREADAARQNSSGNLLGVASKTGFVLAAGWLAVFLL